MKILIIGALFTSMHTIFCAVVIYHPTSLKQQCLDFFINNYSCIQITQKRLPHDIQEALSARVGTIITDGPIRKRISQYKKRIEYLLDHKWVNKISPVQMSILAKSWPAHTHDTTLLFRLSRYISPESDLKEMTDAIKQLYLRGCRTDQDAFMALSVELIERNCKNDLSHLNPADVIFPCLCLPRMRKSLKDLIVKIASSKLSDAVRDTIFSYVVHQKLTHGNTAYDEIILILSRNGAKGATLNPVELRALYVELAQSNNQNSIG